MGKDSNKHLNDRERPHARPSYILAITLLFEKKTWRALFLPLANVGRMALTNYLFAVGDL